jgi:hypothetical protein
MRRVPAVIAVAALALIVPVAGTPAAPVKKKPAKPKPVGPPIDCGITSVPFPNGKSIFPQLKTLHAKFLVQAVQWSTIAPTQPVAAADPADPAYDWRSLDTAFAQAGRSGIEIVPLVYWTPGWANGGQPGNNGPTNVLDYANFLTAMSLRYPQIKRWMIWGEPSRLIQWSPQGPEGAQKYAILLDAAYAAIKKVDPTDLVIGGNTQPSGGGGVAASPADWLSWLVLPDGTRPRMDLWGHNPFTGRAIDLKLNPQPYTYDFDDLDSLAADLDRYYPGQGIRLFLSESGSPTDHANSDWFYVVSRAEQAQRMAQMLQIVRTYRRIAAISNYLLYDEPSSTGWTTGLIAADGTRKPAWSVFRSYCG